MIYSSGRHIFTTTGSRVRRSVHMTMTMAMTMTMFLFYIIIFRKELYNINKLGNVMYNMTMYGDYNGSESTIKQCGRLILSSISNTFN